MFHKAYAESPDAEAAEATAEEEEAIGGSADEPLLESDMKKVTPIVIPEWFCATICAGLDLDYLFEGQNIEEAPTQPVPTPPAVPTSIGQDPAMAGEENLLINTGRFGVDPNLK